MGGKSGGAGLSWFGLDRSGWLRACGKSWANEWAFCSQTRWGDTTNVFSGEVEGAFFLFAGDLPCEIPFVLT